MEVSGAWETRQSAGSSLGGRKGKEGRKRKKMVKHEMRWGGGEEHVVKLRRSLHACGGHIYFGSTRVDHTQIWSAGVDHTLHTNRHMSASDRPKLFTLKKNSHNFGGTLLYPTTGSGGVCHHFY